MKKLIFALLFFYAGSLFAAQTEFYIQTTGSNLNAGSSTADAALVTSTNGNWDSTTGVFICAGATDLSGVSAGMFASVYTDGASVTGFVGRITAVVDATDTITVSTTAIMGTAPTTNATARSINVGGAWAAGSGTFPFALVANTLTDSSGNVPRVNIKSGSYSLGATTFLAGLATGDIIWRGYNSTIGDLDNQGRNADTTLNVTNFPVITVTGLLTPASWFFLQNISFTGALSGPLIGNVSTDNWGVLSCSFVNTQNNAAAIAMQGDNYISATNSDFSCTGAAHGVVLDIDEWPLVRGCRLSGVDSDALLTTGGGTVIQNIFYGNSANKGLAINVTPTSPVVVSQNTFYNLTTAFEWLNAANAQTVYTSNNMVTDCSKWIDSLYVGTANISVTEICNRTRDVTTLLTGVTSLQAGAVTTDTGGAETDYVNAGAGNLRLISTSPAVGVGNPAYLDIGALQVQQTAGGQRSYSY